MVSLSLLIDDIKELYLVGHESLVDISMQGLFLGQFTSQEVKLSLFVALHGVAIVGVVLGSGVADGLIQDICLVKPDNALLKLLEITDVGHYLTHIISEMLLLKGLAVQFDSTLTVFFLESLVTQLHILDDQVEIVTDSLEVSHLDLHLVDLFV